MRRGRQMVGTGSGSTWSSRISILICKFLLLKVVLMAELGTGVGTHIIKILIMHSVEFFLSV